MREVKKNACSPAQLDFGASDVCPPRTQTGPVVWCDRVQRRASCLDPDQGSRRGYCRADRAW